eukprot:2789751-Amphidinium_carterae.1
MMTGMASFTVTSSLRTCYSALTKGDPPALIWTKLRASLRGSDGCRAFSHQAGSVSERPEEGLQWIVICRQGDTEQIKLADLGSCRGIYSRQPYTEYISTRWELCIHSPNITYYVRQFLVPELN